MRVSLSQGQRHSSISADRASLEGGVCMMLCTTVFPTFLALVCNIRTLYVLSSSSASLLLSLPDTNPAIDRPLSANSKTLSRLTSFFSLSDVQESSAVLSHLPPLVPLTLCSIARSNKPNNNNNTFDPIGERKKKRRRWN